MNYPSNRLSDLKPIFRSQLKEIYAPEETENLINILIEHYLGLNRIAQALNPELRLSESELLKVHFAMKRLLKSEPIQYILGETTFCGLRFVVSPDVLIPRPETEELVDLIAKYGFINKKILDIGTGSGCIAVALKSNLTQCEIAGLDVSKEALKIAEKNAQNNKVEIELLNIDITDSKQYESLECYDIIVSNPPYVTYEDKNQMSSNVLEWEPQSALFAPEKDPLFFYNKILEFSKEHLSKEGYIFLEINENYGKALTELTKDYSFNHILLRQDFRGKDRFLLASK
ncbi:MAG: peptide chain release factor N(5)-glutamine methyltransferase [Bacteroidales bacterium]|nr:peptide chain release factor N(5)-glutamine methyltransferase [Bacteroidales bacterium]